MKEVKHSISAQCQRTGRTHLLLDLVLDALEDLNDDISWEVFRFLAMLQFSGVGATFASLFPMSQNIEQMILDGRGPHIILPKKGVADAEEY